VAGPPRNLLGGFRNLPSHRDSARPTRNAQHPANACTRLQQPLPRSTRSVVVNDGLRPTALWKSAPPPAYLPQKPFFFPEASAPEPSRTRRRVRRYLSVPRSIHSPAGHCPPPTRNRRGGAMAVKRRGFQQSAHLPLGCPGGSIDPASGQSAADSRAASSRNPRVGPLRRHDSPVANWCKSPDGLFGRRPILPKSRWVLFQVIEYLRPRAFHVRAGWAWFADERPILKSFSFSGPAFCILSQGRRFLLPAGQATRLVDKKHRRRRIWSEYRQTLHRNAYRRPDARATVITSCPSRKSCWSTVASRHRPSSAGSRIRGHVSAWLESLGDESRP